MSDPQSSDLLHYYKRELSYLRGEGADFARRYPKVAAQLALHGAESQDPHTERLIEAVAFLGARVHRDLDQEFPQIAAALLDNLCPSLVQPLPSMTVTQFTLDPSQGKVTAGFRVPRHTPLFARTTEGRQCRFRTAWDTVVWPIEVAEAVMARDGMLRLTLACTGAADFAELEVDHLRLHLQGDWTVTMPLYDALVGHVVSLAVAPAGDSPPEMLPAGAWREAGFADGEEVLPLPPNGQPAYGLLQEYFAFPRKFHFFDLRGLRGRLGRGRRCDLLIRLDRPMRALAQVDERHFQLGCTPAVNLFSRVGEPLRMDHRAHEHLLVGDRQREADTEVHSILAVTASDPDAAVAVDILSFAALGRLDTGPETVFWSARRTQTLRGDLPGTDMYLTFVDQANVAQSPRQPVVYAHLLCTNRRLAEQVPPGAHLVAEGPAQPTRVRCLYEPTPQRDPPLDSETLWRLVALLTLNHASLVDGSTGGEQLREMLRLFAADTRRDHQQLHGIRQLVARPVTAHLGLQAWRGYARGTEVEIEFEEEAFAGGSSLLLAAVLARFFALYTSVNSFVQLVVRQGDEIRKQWPPMTGRQAVL